MAGLTILIAHAAIVAVVALWYARRPVEPNILPAIAVTLAPVEASSPQVQNQDIAVGPTMQQAEETPKEPPKVEEKPLEQVVQPPSPPQQAEVTLPQVEPKDVEKPKPEEQPPAPETRAPPKTEHVGQFTQAGSNAYNALVFGHLQRFKRYPSSARGAQGTVVVRFVLNRAGAVTESAVTKSSGNDVLDREALEILRRASPFPPFPVAKPGSQDSYIAPVNFAR
ncbi:energy transducer TonB [Bradyrhizobium sp. CB82]|uniref:energy transducer TonB n=1 Tax=Bradyrhizobium sp. CB82 TaxID=3039159 RepID=UPI0024B0E0F7|nr:energy transducer TonB [Bradyrhizobium sp. CB82]WFU41563.1 energy transducer TonB [Bradyrhizobium sp. CB82]